MWLQNDALKLLSEQISLTAFKGALHPFAFAQETDPFKVLEYSGWSIILSIKEKFKAMAQLIATPTAC